jgi:deoxyribonuclease-4
LTKSPNQWHCRPIAADEAAGFRKAVRAAGLRRTLAHDSYLINLASPDDTLYRRSIDAFTDEVQRAELLGLNYLVTHPGAHLGAGEDEGLRRVITALDDIHGRTNGVRVKVLIETTAGQGTCLGHRFEHLKAILAGVAEPKRLGVCVDTCHIFAAGYALSPSQEYRRTMRELHRVIGKSWVRAFHLNDSLKPFASRRDRHAHIGQGEIGPEAFGFVVNDPWWTTLPMILETPKENQMDAVNLRRLNELLGSR